MSAALTPAQLDQIADAIAERLAVRIGSNPINDKPLDVHEAAELLGCSVSTIERARKRGEIKSVKVGNLIRYRRADLLTSSTRVGLSSIDQSTQK